jgi:hypothetical protein
MKKVQYEILKKNNSSYNLPIFLDAKADEMGVMVGFDGEIEQVEQLCNFTYKVSGNTVTVYNTTNTNVLKRVVDAVFQINWGDTTTSTVGILGNVSKTYTSPGKKTITITMNSPWTVQNVKRTIPVPSVIGDPTSLGTLAFTFPYTDYGVGVSGSTKTPTNPTFVAIGKSRIGEKKLYGQNTYSGTTSTTFTVGGATLNATKYSIDGLDYYDCSDSVTYIVGKVPSNIVKNISVYTGNTTDFATEYVTNKMLTRNEHFLGFISEPQVYSDVFVERGKMGVSEFNLRLTEIDNVGELDIYGNGFFIVKKQ